MNKVWSERNLRSRGFHCDFSRQAVVWRKKMGFPVPLHKWFGSSFNDYAKEILLDRQTQRRNLYNNNQLERLLNDKSNFDQHSFGLKIWMLVNLELWISKYFN